MTVIFKDGSSFETFGCQKVEIRDGQLVITTLVGKKRVSKFPLEEILELRNPVSVR